MKAGRTLRSLAVCTIVLLFMIGASLTTSSGEENRLNRLSSLRLLSKVSQLVGACDTEPASIRFWSLESGSLNDVIQLEKSEFPSSIAVSPDESLLAAGTYALYPRLDGSYETIYRSLGCYSTNEKRWLWKQVIAASFGDCAGCDFEVAFTSDGNTLLAAGNRYISRYDARTGKLLRQEEHPLKQYSFLKYGKKGGKVFSPSSRYILAWEEKPIAGHNIFSGLFTNKQVTVWDLEKGAQLERWKKNKEFCSATFTPDERSVVFGTMDGYIWIWSLEDRRMDKAWKVHGKKQAPASRRIMTVPVLSRDGRYLATFGETEQGMGVRISDYPAGSVVHEFSETAVGSVEYCSDYPMLFSDDGNYFAAENKGRLCLYHSHTWNERWCVPSWPEDTGEPGKNSQRIGRTRVSQ